MTLTTIEVSTSPGYQLHVGPGAAEHLAPWLVERRLAGRYMLVTDANVAARHARPLRERMAEIGLKVSMVVCPAGETSKTRATKEMVEDAMVDAGCGRDSAVVAVGGGVITDLAGFVAATYQRGIPCVLVPTTLLAMVDACIGGKTAVDHPKGKNLIGAFHQPAGVFVDIDFLATLSDREYRSGLAEVVKAAVIRDARFFERIVSQTQRLRARDAVLLAEIVAVACEIKADVVASDEKERDLRKILNFGHTIGHAIETLSGYTLAHGEAVSIGMVAEARMAVRLGILPMGDSAAVASALSGLDLPVRLPLSLSAVTPRAILETAHLDKKAREGRVVYVLPSSLGEMARGSAGYGIPIEDRLAEEVLSEMQETAPSQ